MKSTPRSRTRPVARGTRGRAAPATRRYARTPPTRDAVEVGGVLLSSPDRVLYPEQGLTKLEVAQFYESIGEWILPHVKNRLLTLVRCPEGRGKCFYQKHAAHSVPASLVRVPVDEKDGTGEYLAIADLRGLIGLVQMGVLEVHLWGSRADHYDEPDRIVFDLDPDVGIPWARVVEAAHRTRALLDEVGLRSFLKTTGGKGLHVVVPLQRRREQTWEVVKEFSHRVVQRLTREAPERFTTNPLKVRRKGKIFLDYLRNARGATAIAPYSTRAKPGATVAVPIAWEELSKDIRSDTFTVRTTPKRLATLRRDPWAEMDAVRQSLSTRVLHSMQMA